MGALERVPGVQNWIERLSPATCQAWNDSIIYRSAVHQNEEHGVPVGEAIASAINWAKYICSTGDVKQFPGMQHVNPPSRAECCAAVALWETMRTEAHSGK